MKNYKQTLLAGLAVFIASCGSDGKGAAIAAGEVHACEILPGAEVARIAGAALVGSSVDAEQNYGTTAFSQCTHTLDGSHRRVTVQIRRSGTPIDTSRQAGADKVRLTDDGSGYGIQFAESIEAGTDIHDLGHAAYFYEIEETLHLVAYKDKHVEVRVWMAVGKASKEQVLRVEKEIALTVIKQI